MEKGGFLYILTTRKNTALYIGVTANLEKRIWEHKNGVVKGHAKKYNITKLIYFEKYDGIEEAIHREKSMKKWKRDWKVELIEKANPEWREVDLGQSDSCFRRNDDVVGVVL